MSSWTLAKTRTWQLSCEHSAVRAVAMLSSEKHSIVAEQPGCAVFRETTTTSALKPFLEDG